MRQRWSDYDYIKDFLSLPHVHSSELHMFDLPDEMIVKIFGYPHSISNYNLIVTISHHLLRCKSL